MEYLIGLGVGLPAGAILWGIFGLKVRQTITKGLDWLEAKIN